MTCESYRGMAEAERRKVPAMGEDRSTSKSRRSVIALVGETAHYHIAITIIINLSNKFENKFEK